MGIPSIFGRVQKPIVQGLTCTKKLPLLSEMSKEKAVASNPRPELLNLLGRSRLKDVVVIENDARLEARTRHA